MRTLLIAYEVCTRIEGSFLRDTLSFFKYNSCSTGSCTYRRLEAYPIEGFKFRADGILAYRCLIEVTFVPYGPAAVVVWNL
jgi:hypothetical protein